MQNLRPWVEQCGGLCGLDAMRQVSGGILALEKPRNQMTGKLVNRNKLLTALMLALRVARSMFSSEVDKKTGSTLQPDIGSLFRAKPIKT